MLKENYYYDGFTEDTTSSYTWTIDSGGNYVHNNIIETIDYTGASNSSVISSYEDSNIPNTGYYRVVFHISETFTTGCVFSFLIYEDVNNYYRFVVSSDNTSVVEEVSKKVGAVDTDAAGPRVGSIHLPVVVSSQDIDVEIEIFWSPTYLKMLIDGENELTLDTSDTTELNIQEMKFYTYWTTMEVKSIQIKYGKNSIDKNKNVISNQFSEVGPTNGLIAYWPLSDNLDYAGNNLDGTAVGTPTFVGGLGNRNAVTLAEGNYYTLGSRANDYINFGTTDDFSISAWYKTSYTAAQQLIFFNGGRSTAGYMLTILILGALKIKVVDDASTLTNCPATDTGTRDGKWHHVVVTRDTTNSLFKIYLDGSYNNQAADLTNKNILSSEVPAIGQDTLSPDANFIGSLQDIRIYNKVLSASEVNILYKMLTDQNDTSMQLARDVWYVSGEFKEKL